MSSPDFELFHKITDPASARTRKALAEAGLLDRVEFRNITTGQEAARDYQKLEANDKLPVLRSKNKPTKIYLGEEAIFQWIKIQLSNR